MPVFALDVRQGKVRTISKRHRLPAFLPPGHSPPELGASVGCVGHVKPAPGFPVVGRQTQHAQMLTWISPLRTTRHPCCRGGLGWGTRCGYRLKCTSAGVGIDWLSGNCVVAANARVTKPFQAGVFTLSWSFGPHGRSRKRHERKAIGRLYQRPRSSLVGRITKYRAIIRGRYSPFMYSIFRKIIRGLEAIMGFN